MAELTARAPLQAVEVQVEATAILEVPVRAAMADLVPSFIAEAEMYLPHAPLVLPMRYCTIPATLLHTIMHLENHPSPDLGLLLYLGNLHQKTIQAYRTYLACRE